MSDVHIVVRSQDSKDIYPLNKPHDFTVNLKPHLSLEGEWKIGVREISHSTKVANLQGHREVNTITFQWMGKDGKPWRGKTIELAEDASFLTPQEIITYIDESFVHIPRKSPNNTTYTLSQLVTLDAKTRAIRKTLNSQALIDIPHVTVYWTERQEQIYMRVRLFVLNQNGRHIMYHQQVKTANVNAQAFRNTWSRNRRYSFMRRKLYTSFTSLPKKRIPSEEQKGPHKYFSLTDVATLSYDPCLRKFKLSCNNNIEHVSGIKMTMNSFLAQKMGLDDETAVNVKCGNSITFSCVQTLAAGYEALAVNCSLVRPCQLGDTSANLLTLTPLMANNVDCQSKYAHNKYKRINYAPLLHSSFEALRINFTSIRGQYVEFASGAEETQISLHLKKHKYGPATNQQAA